MWGNMDNQSAGSSEPTMTQLLEDLPTDSGKKRQNCKIWNIPKQTNFDFDIFCCGSLNVWMNVHVICILHFTRLLFWDF